MNSYLKKLPFMILMGTITGCSSSNVLNTTPVSIKAWQICPNHGQNDGFSMQNNACEPTVKTPMTLTVRSAPLAPLLASNPIEANENKDNLDLTLYFDVGYSKLSRDMVNTVKTWVKNYRQLIKGKSLLITGYTDPTGPKDINNLLAQQRANAVSDLLVQMGVSQKQFTIKTMPDCCRAGAESIEFARQRKTTVEVKE